MRRNQTATPAKRLLRMLALVLVTAAACLLLADCIAVYADVITRNPEPYIQNRTNWCWATCAKMVGERYNTRYRRLQTLPRGAVRAVNMVGLRPAYAGIDADGAHTIDAGQQSIVIATLGSDVNNAGYRQDTFDAMSYATASEALPQGLGNYLDGSVLRAAWNDVQAVLDEGMYVIGNVYNTGASVGHSLVITGYNFRSGLYTVYDVWDGTTVSVTKGQLLSDGFHSSYGTAAVTWVYYCINPDFPPKLADHTDTTQTSLYDQTRDAPPTAAQIRQDALGLKEYMAVPPSPGAHGISGSAPYNYIIYTQVNNGGYYATRADENGRFRQLLMKRLHKGDIVTMYCESPLGVTTEKATYIIQ